ncbi:mono ADP-ribose polymerase PARP16 [Arapaima gigas]
MTAELVSDKECAWNAHAQLGSSGSPPLSVGKEAGNGVRRSSGEPGKRSRLGDEILLPLAVLHATVKTMRLRMRKASQQPSPAHAPRPSRTKRRHSEVEACTPTGGGRMEKSNTGLLSTIKKFIRGNAVQCSEAVTGDTGWVIGSYLYEMDYVCDVCVIVLQLADVSSMPGVRELVRLGPGKGEQHLALAHWVLSSRNFAVKTLQREEYTRIRDLTECEGTSTPVPDFLFELEYCDQMNAVFEKTRGGRDLLYAFHGSRLENFHSIIHNGLHCHLNKACTTSLFGEGTYLTSDLSLALLYSPHGNGWQESLLGPLLSCVAVCEIIDHPDVKCQVKKKDSDSIDRQRARVKNSEGGEVPQKYFVVTNNQLLRVKYLLVYSQKRHHARHAPGTSWLVRHHFAIMMSLYLLLLMLIGAFNSAAFQSFWQRLFR